MPRHVVRCPPEPSLVAGFNRIREQLDVPSAFPDEVLEAAREAVAGGPRTPPGASSDVRDRRDIEFVAVDPAGSTDLDQAFAAERRGAGHRVYYAIADVAAFVAPGDPVDIEARERGVTLYSPDRRTPLHPESISEGAGSLLEGEDRPALLWTIDLDETGELEEARLERATVRNRRQLSYRAAQDEADSTRGDHPVTLLREIGGRRTEREAARGGVSLALPAQEVRATGDGSYVLEYDEALPVEDWNAQISLLTGIAASQLMLEAGVGLLRTLPEPDPRTVSRLRRTARALDIDWPDDVDYATRIRTLRPDTPETAALLSQSASGLRGAGYVAFADQQPPDQPRHSAIASTYAHVTAPLRRLCDRFANEIVVAHCADREPPAWAVEALEELPSLMGRARHRDRALEHAVIDYVEAVTLAPHVGERFHAVVTDVNDDRGRGRVQLRQPAVVATLPAAGLELGAEVELRLEAAEPDERQLRFSLIG